MSQRNALVTGGAGFIGSHLVDRLVQEGFHVAAVDNFATGSRENLNKDAVLHQVDICSEALGDVFRAERPEIVFHLAAQTSVVLSVQEPAADARSNILGSLNILEQCRQFGVERIVYCSTGGALYGDPQYLPCDEGHPIRPVAPYGASKYAVESYVHCFSRLAGFRYTILRCGNVYGPRQDPHGEAGVVAIFAGRMLEGDQVSIFGDGEQQRDFVYVTDIVEAHMKALEEVEYEAYNIGTGDPTSVNTIFAQLAKLTGYQQAPVHQPPRRGEVFKIYLDVGKAREKLGWKPAVDLETGLTLTASYFRGVLKSP